MDQQSHFDAAYHGVTTLHPLGMLAVLVLGCALLVVPRRYAIWPMIMMACFIPSSQRIVIASLDFDLLRIMVLFGTLRVFLSNEWRGFKWCPLDWAVLAFALGHIAFGLIRAGPDILVNKLGFAYDIIGMYFLFRMLVRDWGDVKSTVLAFSVVALPVALAFALEWATRRNVFAVFGGVNEITMIRDGRLRCQGAFSHPILAGIFWVSLLPLFAVQAQSRGITRWLGVFAFGASLWIVFACSSATPVTGVVFAGIGAAAFFIRFWMRWVRWSLLAGVLLLHLIMNAPVWHLLSRVEIVGGNSGYHRYLLIDEAIRHLNEWWLFGSRLGTEHWGFFTFDVTNTYIVQGLHGGVGLLAIFIIMIAYAFGGVGRTWRAESDNRILLLWSWALGTSLLVHVTSFVAITYFGQINMLWYLLLAMIGSISAGSWKPRTLITPAIPPRMSSLSADRRFDRAIATVKSMDRPRT